MSNTNVINVTKLSEDLVLFMKRNSLNQTDVGALTGISKSTISRIIALTGRPDADNITALCKLMKKSVIDYMDVPEVVSVEGATTMDKIKVILNNDPKLSDDSKKSLFDLMEMAYTQFSRLTHV